MKYVLICDKIEKEITNFLPKSLNYINNIPSDEIYIIYNIYFQNFNFEEIVKNLFKTKNIYFSVVDYFTRGEIETTYVGISNFNFDNSESIVFLNYIDNIYNFENLLLNLNENFIAYSLNNDNTKIAEGLKLSDNYCCGIYGFKNVNIFNKYAKVVLYQNLKTSNAFYFSKIYELMIKNMEKIVPLYVDYYNEVNNIENINTQFITENIEFINNKANNNKYNSIEKKNNTIVKKGDLKILKGEVYFYKNIPENLSKYFTTINNIKISEKESRCEIEMGYINAIPIYFLHKNKLITKKIIDDLFIILDELHNTKSEIIISKNNIHNNYFKKLEDRFNKVDYFFEDSQEVFNKVIEDLKKNYSPKIAGVIHGDFWFSNIMLDYTDNYKLIDMKGQVDNILTLNGDIYYDYGKMYKCVLGYDLYFNDCKIDHEYLTNLQNIFLEKCKEKKINIEYLTSVTKSLIFGVFHAIDEVDCKIRIWNFLKKIL